MLQCMDRGTQEDCVTFSQLFTEEAVLRIPLAKVRTSTCAARPCPPCQVTKHGRPALSSLCSALHAKFSPATHWEGNVVLSWGEGGGVTNYSYWQAVRGGEVVSIGTHQDVFDKVWPVFLGITCFPCRLVRSGCAAVVLSDTCGLERRGT